MKKFRDFLGEVYGRSPKHAGRIISQKPIRDTELLPGDDDPSKDPLPNTPQSNAVAGVLKKFGDEFKKSKKP